ncbi:hypothetical protein MYU51_007207 [Penicillium brevicompactum]|uniref:uncharacterized protein n=1 Tax=Penicillium brevicompactum TaxID=5074 RepID=UPI002540F235|nr:uncharacterized protein N7506_002143 [Penicillium brevicompactum]KAJ5348890.1 hypothetical protein N7506_002143 [Penicillium brevicompactum]
MHSFANLGPGELNPFPTPAIRKIGFSEDPAQFTVAKLLILAWPIQRPTPECNSPPIGDFEAWVHEIKPLTLEERDQLPRDSDTNTLHTPWRDQVYFMWNHVYYDVGNWMSSMYGTRSFQPPNIEAFAINFPTHDGESDDGKTPAAVKVWDAEALFTAAYLAPGITLRVETLRSDQEHGEPFHSADIKHEERFNVLYTKQGIQVRFHVDGEWYPRAGGLAAVIVHGTMLGEPRQMAEESEESGESGESGLSGESGDDDSSDDGDGGGNEKAEDIKDGITCNVDEVNKKL